MQRLVTGFLVFNLLFSIVSNAQFEKGTRMAGASVASMIINSGTSDQTVSSVGSTTAKVTGFSASITPSIGWFVSENTAVGFTLNISPWSEKITFEENGTTYQSDKKNTFNIGLGGFVRNYFASSGSVLPFGQFAFDAGISNQKKEGFFYGAAPVYKETYDGKSSGGFFADAFLTGGITKMVGEHTGLDFYIGYNFAYNKNTVTTTTQRDDLNNGSIDETGTGETTTKFTNHKFVLGIGFQIFLEKKKK